MDGAPPRQTLDNAVALYTSRLTEIEAEAARFSDRELFQEIDTATAEVLGACAKYEGSATPDETRAACAEFHRQTEPWFSQSAGMTHARKWPHGYQGDYEILEWIYAGLPRSESRLGAVLDSYLLSRTMAIAARGRKTLLCDLLLRELRERETSARILSIACGSCRDVFDIAGEIQRTNSHVACVDRDSDALAYAKRLLLASGISPDRLGFHQLNALRLVSPKEAIRRFGELDIVYSVGFLDYLDDDRVGRLLKTWYQLLKPGGALVVAMKDVTRFEPYSYRWLIDWTGFRGRTEAEMAGVFDAAQIPENSRKMSRDPSGVVLLWRAVRG